MRQAPLMASIAGPDRGKSFNFKGPGRRSFPIMAGTGTGRQGIVAARFGGLRHTRAAGDWS